MTVATPSKSQAVGVSFNAALGYPQVSIVYETGTKRFLRRYSMSSVRLGQKPCVLTYEDFRCNDFREQLPESVCHLIDQDAIDSIERLYDQIRRPVHAYLASANAETERELCTAIEMAGL